MASGEVIIEERALARKYDSRCGNLFRPFWDLVTKLQGRFEFSERSSPSYLARDSLDLLFLPTIRTYVRAIVFHSGF